jgi:hypothetical protein
MNPRHHHNLSKLPRICDMSCDFSSDLIDHRNFSEDYKENSTEIDKLLDTYNINQTEYYRTHFDPEKRNGFNGVIVETTKGPSIVLAVDNKYGEEDIDVLLASTPDGTNVFDIVGAVITNVKFQKSSKEDYYGQCLEHSLEMTIETTLGDIKLEAFNHCYEKHYPHTAIALFNGKAEFFAI